MNWVQQVILMLLVTVGVAATSTVGVMVGTRAASYIRSMEESSNDLYDATRGLLASKNLITAFYEVRLTRRDVALEPDPVKRQKIVDEFYENRKIIIGAGYELKKIAEENKNPKEREKNLEYISGVIYKMDVWLKYADEMMALGVIGKQKEAHAVSTSPAVVTAREDVAKTIEDFREAMSMLCQIESEKNRKIASKATIMKTTIVATSILTTIGLLFFLVAFLFDKWKIARLLKQQKQLKTHA